jgi:hypothetical protein
MKGSDVYIWKKPINEDIPFNDYRGLVHILEELYIPCVGIFKIYRRNQKCYSMILAPQYGTEYIMLGEYFSDISEAKQFVKDHLSHTHEALTVFLRSVTGAGM